MPKTLMIQGTTSDAGKTTLVAALCRIFKNKGIRVAPFKPQNMALNSAVTEDGGEIGRGQAVQAHAAGLAPHTDMNPILLKPSTDVGAQVIVHGKALTNMEASAYHDYKKVAMQAVLQSYQRLQNQYQAILVEGAGSPAEINLREGDIANMGFAEAVDCPVILIADIDKGGVLAHLVGTLELLSPSEQQRVVGFVINRFRGDIALLKPGLSWLEEKTGKPVLGVIPYINKLHIEAEDALTANQKAETDTAIKIRVPVWQRISNHTDFDPLRLHPQVDFEFVGPGGSLEGADLIILPGTKNTCADLQFMRAQNWDSQLAKHLRYGGKVLGICGGLQMLGKHLHDPLHIESTNDCVQQNVKTNSGESANVCTGIRTAESMEGLGYLNFETTFTEHKTLTNVSGTLLLPSNRSTKISGYEIHAGISRGPAFMRPLIDLNGKPEGVVSEDGQIIATYLHGLFNQSDTTQTILEWAGLKQAKALDYEALLESELERLAQVFESNLDMPKIESFVINAPQGSPHKA